MKTEELKSELVKTLRELAEAYAEIWFNCLIEGDTLTAEIYARRAYEADKRATNLTNIWTKEHKTMEDKRTLAEIFSDIADDFYRLCLLSDDLIEAHKMHRQALEFDRLSREAEEAE